MAKVSIIVPVYNIEQYISKCIESICKQTFSDLEIILVDDGSTDHSGEICDKHSKNDSRIKVLHKENGGLVSARKAGLSIATSDYVTYVDGDDWIDEKAYECMYNDIIKYNTDVVLYGHYETLGSYDKVIQHAIPKGFYDKKSLITNIYPQMISGNNFFSWGVFPSVWDALYRKDILSVVQMEVDDEITMGEDAACKYPLMLRANSIYVSDLCFYHYRQNANSMIKTKKNRTYERTEFKKLFLSVNEKFYQYASVYDVRNQWIYYMLFMMIPRADHLLEGIERLPFLFPFQNVKRNMRIGLYGAGTYGRRLHDYLIESDFCSVVAWFDRNYVELQKEGLDVFSPEMIGNFEVEAVVIANMFADSRKQIYETIKNKCPNVIIGSIDETYIISEDVLLAFGLLP